MYAKHTIEQALEDLRQGKIILVTDDDEDRENEGDMICSARFATTENVNFMAKYAKGLICTPMSEAVARRLGLEQMVKVNTDNHQTAFTVSIDHVGTLRPGSRPPSAATPAASVSIPRPSPMTSAGRAMCSRWWRAAAAC